MTSRNNPQQVYAPWYKKAWFIIIALGGITSAVLLKGPEILQNARILPLEIGKTVSQFQSWVYEDSEWTGHWTAYPEGLIGISDLNLTEVDFELTINSNEGEIIGSIATKEICKTIPFFNHILLSGNVSGNHATVVAFDYINGQEKSFALLDLERKENIITVKTIRDPISLFPPVARLAKQPGSSATSESNTVYCEKERKTILNTLTTEIERK